MCIGGGGGAAVCVRVYALRIVSRDKILHFKNIIIITDEGRHCPGNEVTIMLLL